MNRSCFFLVSLHLLAEFLLLSGRHLLPVCGEGRESGLGVPSTVSGVRLEDISGGQRGLSVVLQGGLLLGNQSLALFPLFGLSRLFFGGELAHEHGRVI